MDTKRKSKKSIISNYYKPEKQKSMKLIEFVNSVESLNKLSETRLPATVAFSLGRFLKELTPYVEDYGKIRGEKVGEYGAPALDSDGKQKVDEKGNLMYTFTDHETNKLTENGEKFVAEMSELENKEVSISIPEIKIADLGKSEIEPKYLISLFWLIKD